VPFGGEQRAQGLRARAGLQLLVDSLIVGDGYGAALLVAQAGGRSSAALRARAPGVRLPGDS
jgi:hypothetical protein